MRKEKTFNTIIFLRVLFTLCVIGNIVFIFYNSMQNGAESGLRSQEVVTVINNQLAQHNVTWRASEHFVRKAAHITEYLLLGFFLMLGLRVYTKRVISHISWPLFLALFIAVCDEFLQGSSAGRSPQLTDVGIDFIGAGTGIVIALFILLLVRMVTVLRASKTPL